ncbi:MAG: PQQ-dependent sugar dehydrogenase [Acetobacteraceae bacterium]
MALRLALLLTALPLLLAAAGPPPGAEVRTGAAAEAGWQSAAPGVWRRITVQSLPAPYASRPAANAAGIVARPAGAHLRVPAGFTIAPFASGLDGPRAIRVAPSGEIFAVESRAGRILMLTAKDGAAHPDHETVFARGLDRPFGIAFWPPGPNPRFVYVGETNRVIRYPWHPGAARPTGPAQVIVPKIAPSGGGHWTRDLAFSPDGKVLYVAVGSANNDGPAEPDRAVLLAFDPMGGHREVFASGLRNCAGLTIDPATGAPWCAVNERDGLGNNLPPDYVTHVRQGGFYGWPWYYIGDHPDPRHRGEHSERADRVIVPDVLLEAHSAPLGLTFYEGHGPAAFPQKYQGSLFVALHGSWNRADRTGYKLIRIPPGSTAYQDFAVGFVASSRDVWGRPVGVAVAHDGALLMTNDAGGTIWRIAPAAGH